MYQIPSGHILAPMAGITDSPYRKICRQYGAGLLFSECISSEGVRRIGKMSLDICRFSEEERPIALQLFGNEPQQFADAAAVIDEKFVPELIDINCGCPVKRFVTRGCGGALMQDPDKIGRIVEAVRAVSRSNVSVKLRIGYASPNETASKAALAAVDAGAVLISFHARWVRKARGTVADWNAIAKLREAIPNTPLIGNGDIVSLASVKQMMNVSGCDRVMIARWACGRPWIFEPLSKGIFNDDEVLYPSYRERIDVLLKHYALMLEFFPATTAVHRMRKHIGWYTHGMPHASKVRGKAMELKVPDDVIRLLRDFQATLSDKALHHEDASELLVATEDEE